MASGTKFPIPCMERRDPGVVVPSPNRELVLSQTRLLLLVRADDDVHIAILFACPPESPPTQLPSDPLKHPFWSWMPFENDDVADDDVILRILAVSPPENVDVELVPVTSRNPLNVDVPCVFEVVMILASRSCSMSMLPVMVDVPVPDRERVAPSRTPATSRFPAIDDVPVPCTVKMFDAVTVVNVWDPETVMSLGMSASFRLNEFDPVNVALFIDTSFNWSIFWVRVMTRDWEDCV